MSFKHFNTISDVLKYEENFKVFFKIQFVRWDSFIVQ